MGSAEYCVSQRVSATKRKPCLLLVILKFRFQAWFDRPVNVRTQLRVVFVTAWVQRFHSRELKREGHALEAPLDARIVRITHTRIEVALEHQQRVQIKTVLLAVQCATSDVIVAIPEFQDTRTILEFFCGLRQGGVTTNFTLATVSFTLATV